MIWPHDSHVPPPQLVQLLVNLLTLLSDGECLVVCVRKSEFSIYLFKYCISAYIKACENNLKCLACF